MDGLLSADEIKALRICAKMTREELAKYLGVARMTIHRWETKKTRPSPLARRQLRRLGRRIGKF